VNFYPSKSSRWDFTRLIFSPSDSFRWIFYRSESSRWEFTRLIFSASESFRWIFNLRNHLGGISRVEVFSLWKGPREFLPPSESPRLMMPQVRGTRV
jgi:hypothetical protein